VAVSSATGDNDEQHERRAKSARHMKPVQPIDGRIEGVEQQCGQNERKQHGLHELQEQDDDADRQQYEGDLRAWIGDVGRSDSAGSAGRSISSEPTDVCIV
jgi:hypothetical protein